jgi:hypothetical protein
MSGALLPVLLLVCTACDTGEDFVIHRVPPAEPAAEEDPGASPAAEAGDRGDMDAASSSAGIAQEKGIESGATPQTDRLAREVGDILEARCASCHDQGRSDGGLGDLHDFARAIEQGAIVPGAGAQSPLLLRMSDGSMPPATGSLGKPSSGEIALVTRFIDRLPAAPAAACAALEFRDLDAVYTALLADVQRAPAPDRPFLRYVGLTYASNAGLCGSALERQRSALFKLVNSVSTAPDIRVPQALESDGLLYRIDLRDYGWDRDIDLEDDGSVDFSDGWLALAAGAGPYGVELEGPEADALKRETKVAVPFLPGNALVHAASTGDLYYALIGVGRSGDDMRAALGVELIRGVSDPLVNQAGFSVSRPRQRETRVLRSEQRHWPGRAYWILEDEFSSDSETVYEDPLGLEGQDHFVIFGLPNGLQAYEMESGDGVRSNTLAANCQSFDCSPTAASEPRTIASCHACHEAGLVPVIDDVRAVVEMNAREIGFDAQELEELRRTYLLPEEFSQIIQRDSQLHLDAVAQAGVAATGPEPISFVHFQFELDRLPLRSTAAELGVTQQALSPQLAGLAPALAALSTPDGSVERSVWTDSYASSLCVVHAGSRNHPVACP